MADYKELLRRAIAALPENNGAARRAVYEKARSALVGQLRAITPPLPARDITQHRLQLEDCIRQVEQEASEAVISLGRETVLAARPAVAPPAPAAMAEAPKPVPPPSEPIRPVVAPVVAPPPIATSAMSIEEIIDAASAATDDTVDVDAPDLVAAAAPQPKPDVRVMPAIVARVQAIKAGPTSPVPQPANGSAADPALKGPSFEVRREPVSGAANMAVEPARTTDRMEPALGNQAVARQNGAATQPRVIVIPAPVPVEAALSSVREVEVEPGPSESQDVIERAIEVLDREARGESTAPLPDPELASRAFAQPTAESDSDDAGFADATAQRGAGLTIFLVVFALLLVGVGGAGFWAWREGYVDFDQMFGQAKAPVVEATDTTNVTPTLDPVLPTETADDAVVGPGNTAPAAATGEASAVLSGLEGEDRLTPTPVQPTGNETVLPDVNSDEVKSEERLSGDTTTALAVTDPAASVDPAVLAGSQSLLLEASQDGTSGAVPFSGTVDWSEGVDELGLPTLIGKASIPARNLGVDITIRKNSDPSLPASHLMEVDFKVSDTFIGGTIATLPGVLLKDEELVPGTALVGASARVVGNSFLFALSATPADAATNTALLENRRWMDLAVVYGTGRNAIITLEKDDDAQALFDKVFTAWK